MADLKVRLEPMFIERKGFKTRVAQDMVVITDHAGGDRHWGYLAHGSGKFCPLVGFPNEHLDEVCRLLSLLQNEEITGYPVIERQPDLDAEFVGNSADDNYTDEDE